MRYLTDLTTVIGCLKGSLTATLSSTVIVMDFLMEIQKMKETMTEIDYLMETMKAIAN
jgi:hypothetical protein